MYCLTSSSIDLLMYFLFYIILFNIIITYTITANPETASPLPVSVKVVGIWSCIYNLGQSIWNRIENSSKTGHDVKSLISAFECFFTAIAKV